MRCLFRRSSPALIGIVLFALAAHSTARAEGWKWELVPYLWASDVRLDVALDRVDVAPVEVGFGDLVEKLDLGALVHFEGSKGKYGFFVDASYFELSDDQTIAGRPAIEDGTTVDTALEQLMLELGGKYRLPWDARALDLLFGVRLFDVSVEIDLDPPLAPDASVDRDRSLVDAFVGLRYGAQFADRWSWSVRADAGTGDTDLSWHAAANVGVALGEKRKNSLHVGYRHIQFEAEDDGPGITETELSYSGLMLGYRFVF
ncbi:MAG: hypothetical protein GY716_03515 [bacterium]|nr:hypothetical protein [bacterium]